MNKDAEIKKEFKRLSTIFEKIQEDKRTVAQELIQNAAFMSIMLRDLQEAMKAEGWFEDYKNGANQFGKKVSTSVTVYTNLVSKFNLIIKQLISLLPDEEKIKTVTVDPMEDFLDK